MKNTQAETPEQTQEAMPEQQEKTLEQIDEAAQQVIDKLSEELGEVLHQGEFIDLISGQKQGKELRKAVPRQSQGDWAPFEGRPNPVDLIKEQGETRIQDLLPIRYERMSASAFTFYRGAALIMASDLSHTPNTGINVQVCGDAHISNFGYFASPERDLVFDINDFDETAIGPWEWDIKRLVTSVQICADDLGLPKEAGAAAVRACAASYREAMREFANQKTLDVWYSHASTAYAMYAPAQAETATGKGKPAESKAAEAKAAESKTEKTITKAMKKDNSRAVAKLTEVVDGQRRFKSDPPLLEPIRDLLPDLSDGNAFMAIAEKIVRIVMERYFESLAPDKRHLLSQYEGVDLAHKVVGTGSVGLFDWIMLLQGSKEDDYLVLQIKEARESVIERFVGNCGIEHAGQRVVQGQKAIQTASDILLGWSHVSATDGIFEESCDVYIRQLWDCKGSIDITNLTAEELTKLAQLCGWTLAHAHARTGNRFLIAGYLGKTTTFDEAMVRFAVAYAKQNKKDYKLFMKAIANGELPCANSAC